MRRLYPLTLLAALALHFRMFTPEVLNFWAGRLDNGHILRGYNMVSSFSDGVATWFTGQWINQGAGGYRPLSSVWHHWQIEVIQRGGLMLVTLSTLLLFALCCALSGVLAERFAGRKAGYFAAVASTLAGVGVTYREMLGWWVAADNLLCMAALLAALIYLDTWIVTREKKHLVFTVFYFIAACFSKEYAYIFPFMAIVLALYRAPREYSMSVLKLAGAAILFVAVLVVFRKLNLNLRHDTQSPIRLLMLNWWMQVFFSPTIWQDGVIVGLVACASQWQSALFALWPVALGLFVKATVPIVWRARGVKPLVVEFALFALSFLPLLGYSLMNHRILFPFLFGCFLLPSAMIFVKQKVTDRRVITPIQSAYLPAK